MNEDSWIAVGNHKYYSDPGPLILLLKENGIEFKMQTYQASQGQIEVLIHESDMENYRRIWEEEKITGLTNGAYDHFIFAFDNEKLKEIVENDDNSWSWEDIALAKMVLRLNGIQLDEWQLEEKRVENEMESAKKENAGLFFLLVSYVFIGMGWILLFITNYFFISDLLLVTSCGLGLWIYTTEKETLSGKSILAYNEVSRQKALIIAVISFISLVLVQILMLS